MISLFITWKASVVLLELWCFSWLSSDVGTFLQTHWTRGCEVQGTFLRYLSFRLASNQEWLGHFEIPHGSRVTILFWMQFSVWIFNLYFQICGAFHGFRWWQFMLLSLIASWLILHSSFIAGFFTCFWRSCELVLSGHHVQAWNRGNCYWGRVSSQEFQSRRNCWSGLSGALLPQLRLMRKRVRAILRFFGMDLQWCITGRYSHSRWLLWCYGCKPQVSGIMSIYPDIHLYIIPVFDYICGCDTLPHNLTLGVASAKYGCDRL